MKQSIQLSSMRLTGFALACTFLVALIFKGTAQQIARQEEQQLLSTLYEIIEPGSFDNNIYDDCILITNLQYLGSNEPQEVYLAKQSGYPIAAIIRSTAPDGYNGKIELLVSINTEQLLNGVRVIKHQETPGLGDKIEVEKNDWILGFNELSLHDENRSQWAVKKDGGRFDQFTGATITPRAVVNAVANTLEFFQKNQAQIFSNTASCRPQEQTADENPTSNNLVSDNANDE